MTETPYSEQEQSRIYIIVSEELHEAIKNRVHHHHRAGALTGVTIFNLCGRDL